MVKLKSIIMNAKTKKQPVTEINHLLNNEAKCCSCFDNGCKKVEDPVKCFIGVNSEGVNIGIADGFCPITHNLN